MKEVKELVIGTRYWLDSSKDVSGILVSKSDYEVSFNTIIGVGRYWKNSDGGITFPKRSDFCPIEETAILSKANPLKVMAEGQYCNTNWAVINYIKTLEEQINYHNQQV